MHKTVTKSKFLAFLAVIALFSAVIFAGGCGGSSSSNDKLTLSYDQDKDGLPDIFDEYPQSASKQRYQEAKEFETLAGVEGEKFAVSLPCRGSGTFEAAKDASGEASRYFLFKAEKGKRICVLFSAPEHNLTRAFSFVPDVTIYPYEPVPAPVEEPQDEQEEELELPENEPVTETEDDSAVETFDLIDNSIKYEVEEYGSGAFSALSFTPEKDGIYVMKVRRVDAGWKMEDGAEAVDCSFAFSIFEDKDGNGLDDVWKSDYTRDDFVDVLSRLQPFISGVGKDGTPEMREKIVIWTRDDGTEEMQTPEEAVTDYINALNEKVKTADGTNASSKSKPAMAKDIWLPYVLGFGRDNLGKGLNAVLGPRPTTGEEKVAIVSPPKFTKSETSSDPKLAFISRTPVEFVNTDSQVIKEVSNTVSTDIQTTVGKTPIKASGNFTWTNNTTFSENSTTFKITYTKLSQDYYDGEVQKLTGKVLEDWEKDQSSNKSAFRAKYGDYYLIGYQLGAQCVVTLNITASSREEIKTIEGDLKNIAFTSNNFKQTLKNTLKNTSVKYNCEVIGGGDILLPKDLSGSGKGTDGIGKVVDSIVDNVNAYIKGIQAQIEKKDLSQLAVMNCHFRHISTLPGMEKKFPITLMPASKEYFDKNQELYELLWTIQLRRNALEDVDTKIFPSTRRDPYVEKCDEFMKSINGISTEYNMINGIDKYLSDAKKLYKEVQTITDRYNFWCRLIALRRNWKYKNIWDDGAHGSMYYPDNKTVNEELTGAECTEIKGTKEHKGPWTNVLKYTGGIRSSLGGPHYNSPGWKSGNGSATVLPEDYRVIYVNLTHNPKHGQVYDNLWCDDQGYSFGGNKFWHHWVGWLFRRLEFEYTYLAYNMPYSKYPFEKATLDDVKPINKKM